MRVRFFFFLLLFSACSMPATAQQGYKPGNVIFVNGKADSGTIKYAEWERTPLKISFVNKTGVEKEYAPKDLLSFEVNKEYYITATVQIDKRPVAGSNVGVFMEDSVRSESVFLKVLVKGNPFTLYQYYDSRYHYYLETSPGSIKELMYNGVYEQYKFQLTDEILASQPGKYDVEVLNRLRFREEDLAGLVSSLNTRNDYDLLLATGKKRKVAFSVGAGVTYETLKFSSNVPRYNNLEFSASSSLALAAGADVFFGKKNARTSFRFELAFSVFNTKGVAAVPATTSTRNERIEYTIKQVNIRPYTGIVYNVLNDELFKLNLGAGFGVTLSSYPVNEFVTYDMATGNVEKTEYEVSLLKNWPAGYLQVGAIFKNRYEFRATGRVFGTIENQVRLNENGQRLMFLLCYRF